jgi:hypothetical protein
VTDWQGLDSRRLAHEIALLKFSESDTQPKSYPVPWSFLAFADSFFNWRPLEPYPFISREPSRDTKS